MTFHCSSGVAYREDIDEAMQVMGEVGAALPPDEAFRNRILDDIEIDRRSRFSRTDDNALGARSILSRHDGRVVNGTVANQSRGLPITFGVADGSKRCLAAS